MSVRSVWSSGNITAADGVVNLGQATIFVFE